VEPDPGDARAAAGAGVRPADRLGPAGQSERAGSGTDDLHHPSPPEGDHVTLNTVCDEHGHEPGLPDRELRNHILAQAIRQAEAELREHDYADPTRAIEVLHVALEDALDEDHDRPLEN
jgi:hypothetical protein